ncbi:MAG: ATP synthase subunit I [Gemmatimonadales bacterium]|nr:ATP synthase subunit I [Gemmatimonadales bacterium]
MTEVVARSLLSAAGGLGLGLLYFGGLWWTVRRIATVRFPALLVVGSFLVRTAGAAAGIVLLSGGQVVPLLVSVAGFLVARTILIRVVGAPDRPGQPSPAGDPPSGS